MGEAALVGILIGPIQSKFIPNQRALLQFSCVAWHSYNLVVRLQRVHKVEETHTEHVLTYRQLVHRLSLRGALILVSYDASARYTVTNMQHIESADVFLNSKNNFHHIFSDCVILCSIQWFIATLRETFSASQLSDSVCSSVSGIHLGHPFSTRHFSVRWRHLDNPNWNSI
jgi:hypothetical protein